MRSIIENPIKLFTLFVILLSIVLLIGCQFHCPDIYTNRATLEKLYNEYHNKIAYEYMFVNYDYYKYNLIFHRLGFGISVLLFTLMFKVNNFKRFLELRIFNNKKLIYLWINIIYIIGGFLYFIVYKNNQNFLEPLKIYDDYIAELILFGGIIYYSITNYLTYITFNTNKKNNLYKYSWFILFILLIATVRKLLTMKFIFINILLDFCYVILFVYIIRSLIYMRDKEPQESTAEGQELISKNDIFMYFLIAVTYTLISLPLPEISDFEALYTILIIQTIYSLPAIIAPMINFAVKKFKIRDEKKLKVIKKVFNIISFIYMILMLGIVIIFVIIRMLLFG